MRFIFGMFISFFFISCSKKENKTPNQVFLEFANALSKKDFTKAKQLSTAESQFVFSIIEDKLSKNNSDVIQKFDTTKVLFGNAVVKDNEAKIPITDKETKVTIDFPMKKEEGIWKVAFDMNSLKEMTIGTLENNGFLSQHINTDSLLKKIKSINIDSLEKEMIKMNDSLK